MKFARHCATIFAINPGHCSADGGRGDVSWMGDRVCLALNIGSTASAQQTLNRIDLDVGEETILSQESASPVAISGIAFRPVDAVCPEEHGTIEIRSGQMYLSRINSRGPLPGNGSAGLFHNKPVDDETYQYEIGNEECRLALQVRLQTQRDGGWQSAVLPYWSRPSIPEGGAFDLARAMMNFMKQSDRNLGRPPLPTASKCRSKRNRRRLFLRNEPKAVLADCRFCRGSAHDINGDGVFFTFCADCLET